MNSSESNFGVRGIPIKFKVNNLNIFNENHSYHGLPNLNSWNSSENLKLKVLRSKSVI